MNITKPYGYEYIGNQERLFICPQTMKAINSLYLTFEETVYGCTVGK